MTYPNTSLFIDDDWVDASDERTIPVHNPATGQVIGSVAHASRHDLDRALAAAQRGFEIWRDYTPAKRGTIMRRAAQLIRERLDEIARLITLEQGTPAAPRGSSAPSRTPGYPQASSRWSTATRPRSRATSSRTRPSARAPSPARRRSENTSPRWPAST
jgi:hypothetical protein